MGEFMGETGARWYSFSEAISTQLSKTIPSGLRLKKMLKRQYGSELEKVNRG